MRVPANQPATNVNLAGSGQIDAAGTYAWPFPPWPDAAVERTSYGPADSDHHILILQTSTNNITGPQTGACTLVRDLSEHRRADMFDAGSNTWSLAAGAHYDLNSNEIAASAATLDNGAQDSPGIPMVPLLLRYSEVPLAAQHPLRITFPSPTNWFVWPGTGCCTGQRAAARAALPAESQRELAGRLSGEHQSAGGHGAAGARSNTALT